MELINLGSSENSGDADSMRMAMEKINRNFQSLSENFKIIKWESSKDTHQAILDINENFSKAKMVCGGIGMRQ